MITASLEGVSLHVADLERSVDFYRRIPGAELLEQRPGRYALLRIGGAVLSLLYLPGPARFRMEVETNDLELMYDRLCQAGIEPVNRPKVRSWGETDFRIVDPDGHVMEFGLAHAPAGN